MTANSMSKYDGVLSRQGEAIMAKMIAKDTKRQEPVDRHPFLVEYLKYCVCKLYGILGDIEKDKSAYSVFVFLYWKTTQISYAQMIKRIGGDKSSHSIRIKEVTREQDDTRKAKNLYLQQKAEEFYKNM